jgi:uncharacterized FlaG/YvyC family protein
MMPLNSITSTSPTTPLRLSTTSQPELHSAAEAAQTTQPQPAAKPEQNAPAAQPGMTDMMREVVVRYKLDPDTQSLTLFLVDKNSREVIRSVPPEELQRMGYDHTFEDLA